MVDIKKILCKCRFGIVKMLATTPKDFNVYPTTDQR